MSLYRPVPALRLLGAALAVFLLGHAGAMAEPRKVTVRDLISLTDLDAMSVSPDGQSIAFQTRKANPESNDYQQTWYVMPVRGGAPRRIADGGEAMPFIHADQRLTGNGDLTTPFPTWSPDSKAIFFLRKDKGRIQVWRADVRGGAAVQLTHNDGDVHQLSILEGAQLTFSADARRLFFQTRISQAQLDAALKAEGRSGFRLDERFSPMDSTWPLAPLNAPVKPQLWVYDFSTRTEHAANATETAEFRSRTASPRPANVKNLRGQAAVSPKGAMAWTEARDPNLQGLYPPKTIVGRMNAEAAPVACTAPACTSQFVNVILWRNDREVLFSALTPGALHVRKIFAWRPQEEAAPRLILATEGLLSPSGLPCRAAQDRLICFFEEPTRPRRLVSINLDNGAIETLYDPNPEWAQFNLGAEPRVLTIRVGGAYLPSYLVLPPDYREGERLPLVIVTYVCAGFLRGGDGDEVPIFPLAAQGFAVLCHNHLNIDWDSAARTAGEEFFNGQVAEGEPFQRRIQAGLDVAVDQLDRMGVIDPRRIGLTGLSQGSGTVKWAMFNMPRLTTAIASAVSGSVFAVGSRAARDRFRKQYGIESGSSSRYQTYALEQNIDRVHAPLLVNVSDHEVLLSLSTIFALEDAGRAVEAFVYPGEYHIKYQPAHRLSLYERNIDWMNFWLRGVDDPDPAKTAQYVRWRKMREDQCRLEPDAALGKASYCLPSGR
jgi:dipeptidyl aminopeptidase/acylaminoacyl peptidase